MNRSKQLNVAVCGLGHWGKNYVRVFNDLARSRVVLGCDPIEANLAALRSRFPLVRTADRFEAMLKDASVDAVVIATPAVSHASLALQAMAAGKHVLVEKPMCLTVADAAALTRAARRTRRTLMVGHTFLYNPAVRKMRELVRQGAVGKVYYLKAVRSHLGLIREDVNVVWDLATHDVSIFNFLLGRAPLSAAAEGSKLLGTCREDVAFIDLRYPGNVLANIHVSWADTNKQRTVEIVGSKGRLLFDDLSAQEPLRLFRRGISVERDTANFGEHKYLLRDGDILSPNIKMREPLALQCEHFVDSVLDRRAPLTDAREGMGVVKSMCMIQKAL